MLLKLLEDGAMLQKGFLIIRQQSYLLKVISGAEPLQPVPVLMILNAISNLAPSTDLTSSSSIMGHYKLYKKSSRRIKISLLIWLSQFKAKKVS